MPRKPAYKRPELVIRTVPVETSVERAYCPVQEPGEDPCGLELHGYHRYSDGNDSVVSHRCANNHLVAVSGLSYPRIIYKDVE
jgi:hypothetical protein